MNYIIITLVDIKQLLYYLLRINYTFIELGQCSFRINDQTNKVARFNNLFDNFSFKTFSKMDSEYYTILNILEDSSLQQISEA